MRYKENINSQHLRTIILLLLFFLLNCSQTKDIENQPPPVEIQNSKATTFSFFLKDLAGSKKTLHDFSSELIIVDFWATWCLPCRETIPNLVKTYNSFKDDISIIGISLDEGGDGLVKNFVDTFKIPYPILKGNMEIAQKYNIMAIPTFFFLDKDGTILKKHAGYISEEMLRNMVQEMLTSIKT